MLNHTSRRILSIILGYWGVSAFLVAIYVSYFAIPENANYYAPKPKYEDFYYILVRIFFGPFETYSRWIIQHPEVVTAIGTAFIGWYTYALVQATKAMTRLAAQQEKTSKRHERAYVFGGPGELVAGEAGKIIGVIFTIANYGKTPATIEKILWDICEPKEWPVHGEPTHVIRETKGRDVLFPNQTTPRRYANVDLTFFRAFGAGEPVIFWGRVYYKDVFNDCWFQLFELRLQPPHWERVGLPHNAETHEWDGK